VENKSTLPVKSGFSRRCRYAEMRLEIRKANFIHRTDPEHASNNARLFGGKTELGLVA